MSDSFTGERSSYSDERSSFPCVFCDIVARANDPITDDDQSSAHHIVYEDAEFLAFLDKYPLNPGHTQVIPKAHHRWVWDMASSEAGFLFMRARRVAKALQKVCATDWIIADTGGIGVAHAHIHLIPRFEDDGHGELADPKIFREIPETDMEDLARKIKAEIRRISD